MSFSGICSPVRIKRKRFPTKICMAQLKAPTSRNEIRFEEYCDDADDAQETMEEKENLRLHHQRSWLSTHTSDATLLSLRSMTDIQRKSFRALFDILDAKHCGIVCLSKLASLLESLGADITLSTLMRVTHKSYITKYPHLTFIQFCALLLRDDIKVKLKNKSMNRINSLRYQRKQHIKNMQYIKDTPTEGQQRIIELRKKLDELKTNNKNKNNSRQIYMKYERDNMHNGTHEYVIPISVFIQSWHRKQLINELEKQSYLSKKTLKRTKRYVSKCSTNTLLKIPKDTRNEGMLSRRMLLKTLDSAIDRDYLRSGKQVFTFDNIPSNLESNCKSRKNKKRKHLQKSYSTAILHSKQFETVSSRSFSKAVSNAVKQMDKSLSDFPMYSLKKNESAMEYEVRSSYNALSPQTLEKCISSPSFDGVRKRFAKTPAERFLLKRNSTLPRLLLV